MATVNEKMTAIADNIRNYTKVTEKLSLDDMAESIEEVYKAGQESGGGYDEGYEAGQQAEYDRFWDSFQQNGTRRNYTFGFAGVCWTDDTFNPKYPIIVTSIANSMFSYNTSITSTKVPITIDTANGSNIFLGCSLLAQIPSITVTSKTVFTQWFSGCSSLKEIRFTEDSEIANNVNFSPCPLSHDSLISIIGVLKDFRITQSYDCSFKTWQQEYMESFMAAFQSFDYDKFFKCDYEAGTMFISLPEADNFVGIQFDEYTQIPSEFETAVECAFNESGESITLKFPTTTETRTLTLGEANIKKLTESEKLSITEKGWILA